MTDKIKPCPYCSAAQDNVNADVSGCYVKCPTCEARGPVWPTLAKGQGIRRQALLDAAGLVCKHCANDVPRIRRAAGVICHGNPGDQAFPWCSADPIHDLIAEMGRAGP